MSIERNKKKIRSIKKKQTLSKVYNYLDEFPKDEPGVIYVRQSSLAQAQNNIHSFEMQTDKFVEHFRNNLHCTGDIEIIADDEGISGTTDIHQRAGLSRVMRLIEGKELLNGKRIGWVGAVHVNRFTRDKWLVTPGTIMRACFDNDVRISTLRMNYHFKDEYCQRVFMLEAEESARHLDWMKLVLGGGKATASNNGYYDGRWLVPGYIVDRSDPKRKKYIVYLPHAKAVRWLFQRFLELDGNFAELCREVEKMPFLFPMFEDWVDQKNSSRFTGNRKRGGCLIKEGPYQGNYKPTASGIRSILCNPVYIGWWLPLDGGVVENNHPAIVDEVVFIFAHKRLSSYDLNGERQKPERVIRFSKAQALLKKVLYDDNGQPMYGGYGGRRGPEAGCYRSRNITGLSTKHRFSIDVEQVDNIFKEKLLERLNSLERPEDWQDWEDKLEERQATKEAALEEQRNLIRKQIHDAQKKREAAFELLQDPDIPKTKQMKIDLAEKIAGLEGKVAQFENDLDTLKEKEQDEEVTLYEIHSLVPTITQQWDKLSFEVRLRFIGALVKKVVLTQVSPSWVKIEVYWKEAMGHFKDVGHFKRVKANSTLWTPEEDEKVYQLFANADAAELLQALPDRSWGSISHRGARLGIQRAKRKGSNSILLQAVGCTTAIEDKKYEQEHNIDPNGKNAQWSILWSDRMGG
ncbi:hypothetical protein EPA93_33290 [Ktedonosporobacter rubrisoli]|uniref:Resolvase/invertase-type recombinase catalytic domain-containing protein n=1 Tax=Ktedonosporobacter rubrisoli TaxID=2509675 RepID=A0A4P6JZN7_KTERU|nr:recombinase family protein [Ktedonosporobacter rubrisoli]QBD80586.1 hypothetical protein EPA93_33290 [Ktedonosporobacter rubrisoli]